VCLILGFLLAATNYAPAIQGVLNYLAHWGRQ
jgi:hypothetical protein